ncbi:Ig-like domain-containing protein [Burkholderia stabilis]|uniref:Ig-like domain-containing protein n=1 Tax=Burkholderia stabilis TaxID=95485 RepID=UPI00158FE6C4|nr:Ig-like domain-containing protein [Burkholderia stabilis]
MDNVPPYTGVIAKGGLTNDPRPTVNGRGEAGSIIHVLVDGREVGTAIVAANGTWSFALPQSLRDGEYRLTTRASNDVGLSIPSTSYGIQVDTTPPPQPKIEAVTEGVQPLLSGRAEAYSTVTVYDGKTMLGTAKTAVDGTWIFQVPVGLSNGKHALTVTAMDPAGNTSVASAGFDVTVGPVAPPKPVAQAVLDEMGRDSGSFNFDRLTNDGSAGRLMSGHVSGTLAAGEKVQVSTDGGRTWQDAIVRPDGTWFVVDSSEHAGNWAIETRVINAAGTSGEVSSHDVLLDTTPPPAVVSMQLSKQNNSLTIGLAKSGLTAGDKLHIMHDGVSFEHLLTAAEIAAGKVTLPLSGALSANIQVGVIDQAGNVSQYLQGVGEPVIGRENFNEAPNYSKLGNSTMKSWSYGGITFSTPNAIQVGKAFAGKYGTSGSSVWVGGDDAYMTNLDIEFDFLPTEVSFTWGALDGAATVKYYGVDGKLLGTFIQPGHGLSDPFEGDTFVGYAFVDIISPTGEPIAKISITAKDPNGSLFDNFTWKSTSFVESILLDPAHDQYVTGQTESLYGGVGENVFHVSDVSDLEKVKQIAGNGGNDTLKLTGAGQVLDLTALNSGATDKISGIEILDITGTGNNTLKLSMKDVLNLGHEDLFIQDGHTQLLVKGDAGDRVVLSGMSGLESGSWSNKGLVAVDGYAYNVYENAALNVELIVQHAITTTLV